MIKIKYRHTQKHRYQPVYRHCKLCVFGIPVYWWSEKVTTRIQDGGERIKNIFPRKDPISYEQ